MPDRKTIDMNTGTRKIALVIPSVTALLCSRALFFFMNDAEGPNLLIVMVLALVLFLLSLAAYRFIPARTEGWKKVALVVGLQVLLVVVLYFCGR